MLSPVSALAQTAQSAPALLLEVKRFVVEGENPLSVQETDKVLAPHLGQHTSLATLEAAAKALETAIRNEGYAFHRVIVPAQRPAGGELKLQILKFLLSEVTVAGNQHFSRENILRSVPSLQPGKSPEVNTLGRELSLVNQHPAKRLAVRIKESQKRDHLDAEVQVRDVPSSQTFLSLTGHTRDFDNSINRNTGYSRLTIGHQESNLFDRDHALTLVYTTSPEYISRVTQLGAFYWVPFYGYDTTLNAYYTKSDVDSGTIGLGGQSFDVSGSGEFWGLRATHALTKIRDISHDLSLSLDSRYFKSNVAIAGTTLPALTVGSLPLSLRYTARTEKTGSGLGAYAEYVVNLGGGRAGDQNSYDISRPGAQRSWDAIRWGVDANQEFGSGWSVNGRLRGQYANETLIPGEQFGVGGNGSVRGLRDREASGDKGHTLNLEVRGPQLLEGLKPFAFYDQGYRKHVSPVPGIVSEDHASSIGLGLNWSVQRGLEVSATYANVLNGIANGTPKGHDKFYFTLFYRF
jgi:hemolysin activation/secretion protein